MTIVTSTYRPKRQPRKRAKAPPIEAPLITTARGPRAVSTPPGLLAETPEEHQRRGDAADKLFRELVRRVREG
jgi:hypothetical protein